MLEEMKVSVCSWVFNC